MNRSLMPNLATGAQPAASPAPIDPAAEARVSVARLIIDGFSAGGLAAR